MNKKLEGLDKTINNLELGCAMIGLPLCVMGAGIVMFFGLLGREQVIGTLISVSGVAITSLIFPLIAIELFVGYIKEVENE